MERTSEEFQVHPDASADKAGQAKVRAVMRALSKLVSGKKIYAKNNPILVKFAADFNRTLQTFFEHESPLVLGIEQQRILWHDCVVYEEEKREESLSFVLFKDGIGELTIQAAVTFDEQDRFAEILKEEVHNYRPDDDVVTKMWRAQFDNINYRVLDEYLNGHFGEGRRDGEAEETSLETRDHLDLPSLADTGRAVVRPGDAVESFAEYVRRLAAMTFVRGSGVTEEEHFQNTLRTFFTVSSEELKLCQEERREERSSDALAGFLDEVLVFTLLPDNPSAVRDVTNIVERTIEYILSEANLPSLRESLEIIRRFRSSQPLPDNVVVLFERMEEQFSDTSFLLNLGRRVENWAEDAEELFAYYRAVGKRAIPTLCALLVDLKAHKLHIMACETLIAIEPDDVEQIIDRLDIDDPRVAQDAVYIVSRTPASTVPRVVRQLMYYPDNRVREQVIKYLAGKGSQDALLMLVELLDDTEKHIRLKALAAVEELDAPVIANKVRSMAMEKDFGDRTLDEQEYVYRALGKIEGEGALPYVRQMLEKRSFFGFARSQNKDEKLLAVRALEQIPNEESVRLLRGLVEDENNLVRLKAQRALRAVESALEEAHEES